MNKKMITTLVDAITNTAPMGAIAREAQGLTDQLPDGDIMLPVRLEDVPDVAEKMATEVLNDPEMRAFVVKVTSICLRRLINNER